MNTPTQSYPNEHFRETELADPRIDEVVTGASLSAGTSPPTERIAVVKFWNKFRKM